MKPIDFTKPVQTLDGRMVRILCTDGQDPAYPIVGFIEGDLNPSDWTVAGTFNSSRPYVAERHDLINAPERVEKWGALRGPNDDIKVYVNAGTARIATLDHTGILRITYEDGKPVSVALEDAQ